MPGCRYLERGCSEEGRSQQRGAGGNAWCRGSPLQLSPYGKARESQQITACSSAYLQGVSNSLEFISYSACGAIFKVLKTPYLILLVSCLVKCAILETDGNGQLASEKTETLFVLPVMAVSYMSSIITRKGHIQLRCW